MELAEQAGVKVSEPNLTRYDLFNADECFLTGTGAEIMPVVKIDGRVIGSGKPGPLTLKLIGEYHALTKVSGEPIIQITCMMIIQLLRVQGEAGHGASDPESSGDKMQKLDLCEECAKAKGVNDPTSFAMADLMLGLGASQELDAAVAGVEMKCPRCGFSQADFKKSGRLGCPECYRTFAEGLSGLLKTMHKGTRHVGKAPEALRQSRDNVDRLKAAPEEADQGRRRRKLRIGGGVAR